MSIPTLKRKILRRSSIPYLTTAEAHVDNEVKHERLLTESSKLTSSWATFKLNNGDREGYSEGNYSSQSSANSSPAVHRPNSFTGPLMVAVSGPNSSSNLGTSSCLSPRILSNSCHPSPCPSPTNRLAQGKQFARTSSTSKATTGFASPLFEASRARKRLYQSFSHSNETNSSAEVSYDSSPEPSSHNGKPLKMGRYEGRWPPSSPVVCHAASSSLVALGQSSPSVVSLPSPRLSNCSNTTNSSPFPNNLLFELEEPNNITNSTANETPTKGKNPN